MNRSLVFLALSLGGALLFTACPNRAGMVVDDSPPRPLLVLEKGASVTAEFPADGHWYPSGFLARAGNLLRFEPLGEATHLGKSELLLHIGRSVTQQVASKAPCLVERPGEISFLAGNHLSEPNSGKIIQVRIWNLKD